MSLLANPSGRLIHLARKTGKATVLLDNLWFANGVALSPNEDFVVVSDLTRGKLEKYWLKAEKLGETETFAEGLPGIGDNITPDKNGFWVALPVTADPKNPFILHSMTRLPLVRKFVSRLLSLFELLFSFIDKLYPNDFSRSLAYRTGSTDILHWSFSPRATILRFDWNGNIIAAYHSLDGAFYTHVLDLDGNLYLGSLGNNYIAKVPRKTHL